MPACGDLLFGGKDNGPRPMQPKMEFILGVWVERLRIDLVEHCQLLVLICFERASRPDPRRRRDTMIALVVPVANGVSSPYAP